MWFINGRNNYQFFTQRMNQAAARHFELETNLRVALANAEFELFYQPILDTATRRLHTLEVLLRWRRPGLGIDRAFIREVEQSAEDQAIVAAIMALQNSLQLSVVAEGGETEGQFALLRQHGCQYAQGYLFSPPAEVATAEILLRV